jgi:hypothetical protein
MISPSYKKGGSMDSEKDLDFLLKFKKLQELYEEYGIKMNTTSTRCYLDE